MKVYFGLVVNLNCITFCFCYVNYQLFQGFDIQFSTNKPEKSGNAGDFLINEESHEHQTSLYNSNLPRQADLKNATSNTNTTLERAASTTQSTLLPVKTLKFNCSEDEKPFNIGTYEVPTQRDLVLLIRKNLLQRFNNYQQKALYVLKDIQDATQFTSEIAHKCRVGGGDHTGYKKCVKRVSVKCQVITKSLVISIERQRVDVAAFIEGTICKVKEMKADPLDLLKTLAMEEALLEFALPGFLRLLGACSAYCNKNHPKTNGWKPLRHMTDQDLVVKHFLTKKNYLQLLGGSK